MKIILISLFSLVLFYSAKCQSIGLRACSVFSDNREINTSLGAGLYVTIEDSLEKFGCVLFVDYLSNNKKFNDCDECITKDIFTSYRNFSFGISALWSKHIYSNTMFKFGLLVNYNIADAKRQGQIANWIETLESNYIGAGVLVNVQFQQLFTLPLNLDIFISPIYLININSETDPSEVKSDYLNDLQILNIKAGLAYKIK